MSVDTACFMVFMVGFFGGLMFGVMMAERQGPNTPKPKCWEDMLHKSWVRDTKLARKRW